MPAPQYVIDTVGEVTNPDGDTFRGVILAVPGGTSPEAEAEALRAAAKHFAGRVTLAPVPEPGQ